MVGWRCPHLPTGISLHNTSYTNYIYMLGQAGGVILALSLRLGRWVPADAATHGIVPPSSGDKSMPGRQSQKDHAKKANQTHQRLVRLSLKPREDLRQDRQNPEKMLLGLAARAQFTQPNAGFGSDSLIILLGGKHFVQLLPVR